MRLAVASLVAVALTAAAAATSARASTITPQISSNWSGYAAIAADPAVPIGFTDVTGTWRVPKGRCTVGRRASAAFWVGLGGYDPSSSALEQLGTATECDGTSRTPTYDAWWELVPAPSVEIPLAIRAGDTITAAVLVDGQKITYSLKDVTRGTRFSKVLTASQALDTTSAEWIAEAPSSCSASGKCRVVPLTNFGTVTFTNLAAIGNEHPGTLTDPLWTSSGIELIANGDASAFFGGGDVLGPGVGAVPGEVSSDGRSFSVSWAKNLSP